MIDKDKSKTSVVSTYHIARHEKIEIIEQDEEINIEAIEEIPNKILNLEDLEEYIIDYHNKINELIKAVKQLNNKIK